MFYFHIENSIFSNNYLLLEYIFNARKISIANRYQRLFAPLDLLSGLSVMTVMEANPPVTNIKTE